MSELVAERFASRPKIIEAVPWDGTAEGATPIIDWILDHGGTARYHDAIGDAPARIAIDTLEGTMYANPGYRVIRGVKGEFYPCEAEIFAISYQPLAIHP